MDNNVQTPNTEFSEDETQAFIGKHLLVGITHRTLEDTIDHFEQFHGIIERISAKEGLVIKLHNSNQERILPPNISYLKPASPGQYRLKSIGEVVENSDYTVMSTLYPRGYRGHDDGSKQ